jgi:SAM-dependent methyltransferase
MNSKWPKVLPPLTPEGQRISDDFMRRWHEQLPGKFQMLERFNHGYPVRHGPKEFMSTVEIGAGIGGHLDHENLSLDQMAHYISVEMRPDMAKMIRTRHPGTLVVTGDCQKRLPIAASRVDRIIAIHVLEHLPDLPSCIKEMWRLISPKGKLLIVIPCEGGMAYSMARSVSSRRMFEKLYRQSYDWFIEREHLNTPSEIMEELAPYFSVEHREFFPFRIPSVNLNLCIGLRLAPK